MTNLELLKQMVDNAKIKQNEAYYAWQSSVAVTTALQQSLDELEKNERRNAPKDKLNDP